DGPLKVTGRAMYASDLHFPGMLYAVPVCSTIANGKIESLDASAAQKLPGVRAIYHRGNIGKLFRVAVSFGEDMSKVDEQRPPFEDTIVGYSGQYVPLAVADTFEQAMAAADAVKVSYRAEPHNVSTDLDPQHLEAARKKDGPAKDPETPHVESERGDPEK